MFDILTYGEPALRVKAKPVRRVDKEIKRLLDEMLETMEDGDGLGLAAAQVGVPLRLLVCKVQDVSYVLVNPRISWRARDTEWGVEGCLSLPDLRGMVERAVAVTVSAVDGEGKKQTIRAEGLLARVLQHEIDHLGGVLFTDRADLNTLYWLVEVPAEEAEGGVRIERVPTTWEEAEAKLLSLLPAGAHA